MKWGDAAARVPSCFSIPSEGRVDRHAGVIDVMMVAQLVQSCLCSRCEDSCAIDAVMLVFAQLMQS
jgi:hypothetical protein